MAPSLAWNVPNRHGRQALGEQPTGSDRRPPPTVAALRAATGADPVLLPEDDPRAAAALAAQVGVTEVRAGLLAARGQGCRHP